MNERPAQQPRRFMQITPLKLLLVLLVAYVLIQVQVVVLLIVLALLFATIIEKPVKMLENRGFPRAAGIFTIYGAILASIVVLIIVFLPPISQESREFSRQVPELIEQVAEEWRESDNPLLSGSGYRLLTRLNFQLENPPPPPGGAAIDAIGRVAAVGLGIVSMFVIGFYWLMEKRLIRQLLLDQLRDDTRQRVSRIWDDTEAKVGGWLRGQILLCLIIGITAGIGYYIIGVRFWLLLAILAGIMELIPILGPWVGAIPAVMIALLDSWEKALIVAIFLGILQLAENTVLVPRVMKGTIGLSPLTVFVAVLAGGVYMGVLGALLAIPIAAGLQVVIGDYIRERQRRLHTTPTTEPSGTLGWRGIFGQIFTQEQSDDAPSSDAGQSDTVQSDEPESAPSRERRSSRSEQPGS